MGRYRRTSRLVSFLIFKLLKSSPVIPPPTLFPRFPLLPFYLLINLSIIFSLLLPNQLPKQLQLRMRLNSQRRRRRPSLLSRHRHTTPRVLFTDSAHGYTICFHGDAELHRRL